MERVSRKNERSQLNFMLPVTSEMYPVNYRK